MIGSIRGKLLRLDLGSVILETNGGVGYEIFIPFPTHLALKDIPKDQDVLLYIFHSITDRYQKLFGFLSPKDRALFQLMKSLNGIGELTSLKILSFFDADALYTIATEDKKEALEKIPKVKGKTSEKVLFELKQNIKKLESFLSANIDSTPSIESDRNQDMDLAILGLVQLGFDEKSAKKEVEKRWKTGLIEASVIIGDVLKSL
jgi:Holliday junction DNA helicase RuvA